MFSNRPAWQEQGKGDQWVNKPIPDRKEGTASEWGGRICKESEHPSGMKGVGMKEGTSVFQTRRIMLPMTKCYQYREVGLGRKTFYECCLNKLYVWSINLLQCTYICCYRPL